MNVDVCVDGKKSQEKMIKQQPGGQAVVFCRFFTQLCHSASEAFEISFTASHHRHNEKLLSRSRCGCRPPESRWYSLTPAPPLCVLQTVPEVNSDRDQRRQCASSPFVFHSGTCAFCYTCALQQVQTFSFSAHT